MAITLVRASPPPPRTDPVTLLLLIGVLAVALAAINHIIGVVMNFKIWIKSFIATTLRIGYCTDMPSNIKWAARCTRTRRLRLASPLLPRGHRHGRHKRLRIDSCLMMDGDSSPGYDGKKFSECVPYNGKKGQMWNTFVRKFASAMSLACASRGG